MAKRDKAKPGSAAELSELYPSPQPIAVKVRAAPDAAEFVDATVQVTEMDIRQIAQATRALAPIAEAIKPTVSFAFLAAEHPDEIFAALGIAIGWPAERVALLGGASFGRVATAVWSANQDFFVQLLVLLAKGDTATRPVNGAGATPSAISGAGGTPTPPVTPSATSTVQ